MHREFLHRLFTAAALLCALPALAQAPAPEATLGYSAFHERPSSGLDQRLNGFSLGFRHSFDRTWSLEAAFNRQTGTEGGSVSMRQLGLMAGPRYSRTLAPRWQAFAHVLAGFQQLSAWEGAASDKKNSLALAPGAGVDFALNRNVSLRAQEEFVFTRFAGKGQNNVAFYLGVVLRK
ncbi:outer membrane protein [Geothrix sp. 21YS21S-2]|uniref:outer membrane protein n=1 Tax=Geothrix sp. 21YS21S-2 TaxID=3068893 RepID=UPI0027BB1D7C|nr:outer membrane beta-barrel protein [Geothrix sp. 21YS21S-2]